MSEPIRHHKIEEARQAIADGFYDQEDCVTDHVLDQVADDVASYRIGDAIKANTPVEVARVLAARRRESADSIVERCGMSEHQANVFRVLIRQHDEWAARLGTDDPIALRLVMRMLKSNHSAQSDLIFESQRARAEGGQGA